MKMHLVLGVVTLLIYSFTHAALVVVEDVGGTSALPYYRTLNLPSDDQSAKPMILPPVRIDPYSEADMLPVKSEHLSPGKVENRVNNVPGLVPLFLVGDDYLSRRWLAARADLLHEISAVGLVVNVQHLDALTELRELGAGLEMVPASADDLALRMGVEHYPVLITATGIEQ
ncbi:integrating conjugative element protein (TIGR03765 family) [Pseudomonas lurida]|jgi:integrating conjugative element protein (TIGR03765 family)|uniref:integrating conjugative element protein n=1 Tax=Pseudomonas lurida TaxID=244566 RepID=UPI000C0080BF|nr:integrating conjugative element protein [Pseudomonas lurida]PFG25098.1 integrating conjugative element protein (TIGR03765 family) [Pseudomonas lurida]